MLLGMLLDMHQGTDLKLGTMELCLCLNLESHWHLLLLYLGL